MMRFYLSFFSSHVMLVWSVDAMVLGNFQFRGVLLIPIIVRQGHTVLSVVRVGFVWIFFPSSLFLFLPPSAWE